jgi:hypothetical protein
VKFDLVFIDGLHFSEQVDRDIENSLQHLNPGGTIVLHDCNPTTEAIGTYPCQVHGPWTGDVWKAIAAWRTRSEFDICVVDFDWGVWSLASPTEYETIDTETPGSADMEVFPDSYGRTSQSQEPLRIRAVVGPVNTLQRRVFLSFHLQAPLPPWNMLTPGHMLILSEVMSPKPFAVRFNREP